MKKEVIRETDYKQIERPNSRRGQFFDIFRHRNGTAGWFGITNN